MYDFFQFQRVSFQPGHKGSWLSFRVMHWHMFQLCRECTELQENCEGKMENQSLLVTSVNEVAL